MKKLLSLLSVLTIGGTTVPTTIAASPYQKEENKLKNNKINYSQTNNLKFLNREKRQPEQTNWLISLNVPNIRQVGSIYCGPAVDESVLRHRGLNIETFLNGAV